MAPKNVPPAKRSTTQPADVSRTCVASSAVASSGIPSRRAFIKDGSLLFAGGAIVGGGLTTARAAHAYGTDEIKVALIGCGGRGTGAADQALNTSDGSVRVVAFADVFENNVQTAYRSLNGKHPGKVDDKKFVGLDAFREVLASNIDLVILATPPGFRPLHFEKAIEAGKHVFMEKPVAVDAPGVRRVLAAGKLAEKRGLAVQVGLQRRHEFRYRECVQQLHDGTIGEPLFARAYWNAAGVWTRPRRKVQSELEYQLTNWYYFNWLSGDHITEQHIHNLDVINWVLQSHPTEAQGQGGREVRKGDNTGQIFDHHMVEFTYDSGVKMLSQCRHIPGCWSDVAEHVHGTKGYCDVSAAKIFDLRGKLVWESTTKEITGKGWQQEHHDLFFAIRNGERPNETEYGAMSTMTAILGRMATYSGKVVRWNEAFNSTLSLANPDEMHSLEDIAPIAPDELGHYEVAVPGKAKVI
jgi:myo-inositol 2-dehydrogenase/D-chiro-inositol 1-dehydrogenase